MEKSGTTTEVDHAQIEQLREHRSGIMADNFEVPGVAEPRQIKHNRDFLAAVVNTPLRFEPGSREQYSNAGYVILGGLVVADSGEDYYDSVQRHIYAPAGMSRTGHFLNEKLPVVTAMGYTRGDGDACQRTAPSEREDAPRTRKRCWWRPFYDRRPEEVPCRTPRPEHSRGPVGWPWSRRWRRGHECGGRRRAALRL